LRRFDYCLITLSALYEKLKKTTETVLNEKKTLPEEG